MHICLLLQIEKSSKLEAEAQTRKAQEAAQAAQLELATDRGAFQEQRRAAEAQIQQLKVGPTCLTTA